MRQAPIYSYDKHSATQFIQSDTHEGTHKCLWLWYTLSTTRQAPTRAALYVFMVMTYTRPDVH